MEGKEILPGVLMEEPRFPFASKLVIDALSAHRFPSTVPDASTA